MNKSHFLPTTMPHSQLASPDASRGERYLSFDFPQVGFNNQRQMLVVAGVLAYVLNRTLVLPRTSRGNSHDRRPIKLDELVSLRKMRRLLPAGVVLSANRATGVPASARPNNPYLSLAMEAANELRANAWCCDNSAEDLVNSAAVSRQSNAQMLRMPGTWVYALPYFSGSLMPQVLAISAAVRSNLLRCAADAVARISNSSKRRYFRVHALHMRVRDKRPCPLLDCEACGFHTRPERSFGPDNWRCMCRHRDGSPVTQLDAIRCAVAARRVRRADLIYIATNNASDPQVRETIVSLRQMGLQTLLWDDLRPQIRLSSACGQALKGTVPVSVIEQLVSAAAPGLFFAQFPSSWDEFVLQLRASPTTGGSIATEHGLGQLLLFTSKLRPSIDGERLVEKRFKFTPWDVEERCKFCAYPLMCPPRRSLSAYGQQACAVRSMMPQFPRWAVDSPQRQGLAG